MTPACPNYAKGCTCARCQDRWAADWDRFMWPIESELRDRATGTVTGGRSGARTGQGRESTASSVQRRGTLPVPKERAQ